MAFNGIKFFYTHTCKRNWKTLWQVKIPNSKTLPEVLTIDQVHQIIDACKVERIAVYLWTVYSMGLRLEEGLNLQVGDIDSARGLVHIHRGKGRQGSLRADSILNACLAAKVLAHASTSAAVVPRRGTRSQAGSHRQKPDGPEHRAETNEGDRRQDRLW